MNKHQLSKNSVAEKGKLFSANREEKQELLCAHLIRYDQNHFHSDDLFFQQIAMIEDISRFLMVMQNYSKNKYQHLSFPKRNIFDLPQ
jgi:hypothetical protein